MLIRHATPADATALLDLYDEYERPADQRPSLAGINAIFAALAHCGFIAVAERDGALLGSCGVYFCPNLARSGQPFALVENVIVAAAARQQGVGRALLAHATNAARNADCYKIMLATGSRKDAVHQFYRACGFAGDKQGYQIRFD